MKDYCSFIFNNSKCLPSRSPGITGFVYVVVIFLSQIIFVLFFLLFGMVMYANELKQRKNNNYLR